MLKSVDNLVEYVLYLERKVASLEQLIEQLRGSIEQSESAVGVGYRDDLFPMDHIKDTNN